ncbi:hypothetical protein [Nonlabens xylanidelens]|uniref:hypothetical protein n=1 Tax=Nonlabens xylanidelens TaxID=191564 RepID=UPI0011AFDFD8|nr:hypothetical protein [Nonlabens xylanidelens]
MFDNLTDGGLVLVIHFTGATVDANGDGTATVLPLGLANRIDRCSRRSNRKIVYSKCRWKLSFDPAPNYNGPIPTVGYDL